MGRGAAGPENLLAESPGWYSGRKERLRANPQTMDRDTNRRCQLTRHKRRRKHSPRNHPHWPGLVGSAPQTPRDLSRSRQSRRQNRNGTSHEYNSERPVSGLGSWRGARVASSASPYPPARSTFIVVGSALLSADSGTMRALCQTPSRGRILSRTGRSALVRRDPGASFFCSEAIFAAGAPLERIYASLTRHPRDALRLRNPANCNPCRFQKKFHSTS